MRTLKICILLLIIHLIYGSPLHVFAQNIRSADQPSFMNRLSFEQNFNIYKWLYGFDINTDINSKASILVTEKFNSTLMRVNDNQKKWKDDEQLFIDFSWKFSPKLIGKVLTSSIFFSDRLSGIKNDIKTNSGSLGFIYNPSTLLSLDTRVGYKFDDRLDKLDHGATYLFDIRIPYLEVSEYENSLRFLFGGDEFAVRKNRDIDIHYNVKKDFYLGTSDSLSLTWSKRRRDNYDQFDLATLSIESLEEELGRFSNVLKYHVNDNMWVDVLSNISTKQTKVSRFNTGDLDVARSKQEVTTFNEFTVNFESKDIKESLKFGYLTGIQKNDIPDSLKNSPFSYRFSYVSPDYKSSRISLANVLKVRFSDKDSLTSNFSISRYRYDTPDELNYDDHDELRINAGISQIHYFNDLLKLSLNLGVNLKHLVFIFGERSADNNWMRIFRLRPELTFTPDKKLKWVQSMEILANYVDYDFEQTFNPTDIRSYVFRKFSMQQVIYYHWNRKLHFNINYRLELEENGKLIWDQWKETVITTRRNHYLRSSVDYTPWPAFTFSTGFVVYDRKENFEIYETSSNSGSQNLNDYFSFGPSIRIIYAPHPKLNFSLTGVRRFIDRVEQNRYFINNINLNLSWYL